VKNKADSLIKTSTCSSNGQKTGQQSNMKVALSNLNKSGNKGKKYRDDYDQQRRSLVYDPPPIWFSQRNKKGEEGKAKSEKDATYKEIESYFDLSNKPLGKFKAKIRILRDPSPEDWLVWLKEVDEFYESKLDLSPRAKALIVPQFLTDNAKTIWQKHYIDAIARVETTYKMPAEASPSQETEHEAMCNSKIYEHTVMACTREFLRKDQPAISEKNYLQKNLTLNGFGIREFVTRLKQINDYFPYFPPRYNGGPLVQKLNEDELVSIIIQVMPVNIRVLMLQGNKDPLSMPFDDLVDFIDRLQRSEAIKHYDTKSKEQGSSKKRKTSDDVDVAQKPNPKKKNNKPKKYCSVCKMNNHFTSDCWFAKQANSSTKPTYNKGYGNLGKKNVSTGNKGEQMFTAEQMSALLAHLPSHVAARSVPPRKKRRILMDSSEEEFDTGDCESPSEYFANEYSRSSTNRQKK
jgi:hypothetical protein